MLFDSTRSECLITGGVGASCGRGRVVEEEGTPLE